jgi:hypothetical protein
MDEDNNMDMAVQKEAEFGGAYLLSREQLGAVSLDRSDVGLLCAFLAAIIAACYWQRHRRSVHRAA